jgi:hypothetical protein
MKASAILVTWREIIHVVVVLLGYYVLREEIIPLMDKADANRYDPRFVNIKIVTAGNGGGHELMLA